MKKPLKIAVTTGDPDGIGLEVACKALLSFQGARAVFFLWRSRQSESQKHLRFLRKHYNCHTATNLTTALQTPAKVGEVVEIVSDSSPAMWVQESAQFCLQKKLSALTTGPLSKTCIVDSGFKALGHTEILKKVSKAPHVFMTFLGDKFHVLTTTGHIPLADVQKNLKEETFLTALELASTFVKQNLPRQAAKPIGILGLNPHAGERGLIGSFEETKLTSWIQKAQAKGIHCTLPLVPDAAFLPTQWKKHSLYLCLYHDQALIPFKMIHGQETGAHLSLGLPFIRTSVDHGTAKDLFNKNRANPNSMKCAIDWALRLAESKASS